MRNSKRLRRALLMGLLGCATAAGAQPASADSDLKWGLGSAVSTLLYAPAKALYAGTGVLFGGVAWGLSGGNQGVADAVMNPAVRGDYVVTPAHLRGERKLVFIGDNAAGQDDLSATSYAGREDLYSPAYFQSGAYGTGSVEPDGSESRSSEPDSQDTSDRGFYDY